MNTKNCPKCQTVKPVEEFPLNGNGTRYGYCKPCKSAYERDRAQKKKEDGRQAQENLIRSLRRYGVDISWHEEQIRKSGGVCEICAGGPTGNHRRLVVDHNHATGLARGLLCGDCNRAIGAMGDDPERLRRAVAYLEERGSYGTRNH